MYHLDIQESLGNIPSIPDGATAVFTLQAPRILVPLIVA